MALSSTGMGDFLLRISGMAEAGFKGRIGGLEKRAKLLPKWQLSAYGLAPYDWFLARDFFTCQSIGIILILQCNICQDASCDFNKFCMNKLQPVRAA